MVQMINWRKLGYGIIGLLVLLAAVPTVPAANGNPLSAVVTVETQSVLNDDFWGIGAEYDPFHFMPESIASGYNENWWEVEKRRIAKLQPAMVRVWYQIDWMEPVNDNNDPNVINWAAMQTNSAKMQSLYTVLDYLKAQDIDVMLVAGWKMSASVQSWLGFGGLAKPETSAPTDLEEWAEWVSASLQQLITNKGYTNIKYLQSYNEPNLGDFETPPAIDQKSYYEAMYRAIHNRLAADGLRDDILLAGPDESSGLDWIQYAADNMDDILDIYQGHAYGKTYETMSDWANERHDYVAPTGKPLLITEFAAPGDKATYQNGVELADLIVSGMRSNVSAMLLWRLADQHLPDPLNFLDSAGFGAWGWLPHTSAPRYSYYALGLFSRFAGKHSEVLETESSDLDLHVTSVRRADGQYSVFVVNKSLTTAKSVTLQFDSDIQKTFRRHLYSGALVPTANATLAPSDKSWTTVGTSLTDNELPANSVAVYTSVPEPIQIVTTPSEVSAALGATVAFDSMMKGAALPVNWSVVGGSAYGSIQSNGQYTAPTTMPSKRQAIVKASSAGNALDYDLAVVRFSVLGLTALGGDGQVALEWKPSVGASSYKVKRSLAKGGPYSTVASGVTGTAYTDTGLSNGTEYYYVVSAVNGNGEAGDSLEAAAIATSNAMEDDFSSGAIDAANWTVVDKGLRSDAATGLAASVSGGELTISGTTSVNYWGGKAIKSAMTFHASPEAPLEVEVDRVSLSGTGTGARSVLWLYVDNSRYLHFSQNMDTGVWAYNVNGGSDTLVYANNDYGSHKMKLLHDGTAIKMYIDGIERASVPVNWSEHMYVMLSGGARASGDTIQVKFDNLKVGPVPDPGKGLLEDDFEDGAIDTVKWDTIDKGFRSTAASGIAATEGGGALTLSGTTSVNYWGGKSLRSTLAFHASPANPLAVEVDRVSLSGSGTGVRSALWLYIADNQSIHFSQNMETGVWSYNLNGGSDTLVYADNDYGSHSMKLVHEGSGIRIFLDNVERAYVPVAWSANMRIMLTGEARVSGDSVTAVFDNLSVTQS